MGKVIDITERLKQRQTIEAKEQDVNEAFDRLESFFSHLTNEEYQDLHNALQKEDDIEFNRLLAIANVRFKKELELDNLRKCW